VGSGVLAMEASLANVLLWPQPLGCSTVIMPEDQGKKDWQSELKALWEAPDDQQFARQWSVLQESLTEAMQTTIERLSRRSSAWLHSSSGKSADEILEEDALALSKEDLWRAVRKMKERKLVRVLQYSKLVSYSRSVATKAWYAILRIEHKEWHNVLRAVQKIVSTSAGQLTVWREKWDSKTKVVGLPAWQGIPVDAAHRNVDELVRLAQDRAMRDPSARGGLALDRRRLCFLVVTSAGSPVRLFDLTSAVARLEQQMIFGATSAAQLPVWAKLYYAETFESVWRAFLELEVQQRRVHLLKWPELSPFEIYCRVRVSTIAAALDLSTDVFVAVERRLPLSDEEIAKITKLEIQSVRNLRSESAKAFHARIAELRGVAGAGIFTDRQPGTDDPELMGLEEWTSH
jgi:hypothetical protein